METRRRPSHRAITVVLAVILIALTLGGCASPRPESQSPARSNGKASAPAAPPLSGPSDVTTDEPQQQPRDVVTTGTIVLAVSDVAAASNKFADLAKESGGRVDRRTESTAEESDDAIPTAELTLRIPSAKLDDFLTRAKGVGTVTSLSISHDDVTAQRVDQDARINALQTSVTRLTDLMKTASSTTDLLQAEEQLSKRQAELDSLRSQRATLGDQISYATITVSLSPEPAALPRTGFGEAIHSGWTALLAVIHGAVLAAGFLLPWLPVLAVLLAAVYVLRRWVLRRSR
jgi:Domain of unknown function (DUF4349)